MRRTTKPLPRTFPENIFIIGCGGTGARIADNMKYLIQAAAVNHVIDSVANVTIWLIDNDIVEPKNTQRQPFSIYDNGYLKAEAVQNRLRQFCKVKIIPEFINRDNLPLIFKDERLRKNFAVISAVDHRFVSSQIYFFLKERMKDRVDVCWTWTYTGMEVRDQPVRGINRNVPSEITVPSPYISTYFWGNCFGTPLTDLPPDVLYTDLLQDPGDALGTTPSGLLSCGMNDETVVQSAVGNGLAAEMLCYVFSSFYLSNLILDISTFNQGEMSTATPALLEERLLPNDYPGLVNDLEEMLTQTDSEDETDPDEIDEESILPELTLENENA